LGFAQSQGDKIEATFLLSYILADSWGRTNGLLTRGQTLYHVVAFGIRPKLKSWTTKIADDIVVLQTGCSHLRHSPEDLVEDKEYDPFCFPHCKCGDHPKQSHPPDGFWILDFGFADR